MNNISTEMMITETGLTLPDPCPEELHKQLGQALHRYHQGYQWALGDWYNTIPHGDKKAYCESFGIKYKTAATYGYVCAKYKVFDRIETLTFDHYKTIAYEPDPEKNEGKIDKEELIEKAKENKWTTARLRKERDKAMGRPEKIAVEGFDEKLEHVLSELPKSATNKVHKAIKEAFSELKHQFQDAVEKEVKARMEKEREILAAAMADAKKMKRVWENNIAGIDKHMTEAEYRIVLGCLHPDRAPVDKKERFNQAFEIFKRLEKMIDRRTSAEVAELRGWNKRRA